MTTSKAFKITGHGLNSVWLNGSELLDLTDDIMMEVDPNHEAWDVDQSVEDLEELGYTIQTRPIKESEKAINKLRF